MLAKIALVEDGEVVYNVKIVLWVNLPSKQGLHLRDNAENVPSVRWKKTVCVLIVTRVRTKTIRVRLYVMRAPWTNGAPREHPTWQNVSVRKV